VLRYLVRIAEKIAWADRPEELIEDLLQGQELPPGIDPPLPMSVTFIPATVFDNPALLRVNPEYLPGCCDCRHSSASGCWPAIGRSGPPLGCISNGSGVPLSTSLAGPEYARLDTTARGASKMIFFSRVSILVIPRRLSCYSQRI
jgi:hypothetical protein